MMPAVVRTKLGPKILKTCPYLIPGLATYNRRSSTTTSRISSTISPRAHMHSAAIIGAGPAGLTAVANMLDNGRRNLLWIDTAFQAGRVGQSYREVPR
jgi:hypothetical protein